MPTDPENRARLEAAARALALLGRYHPERACSISVAEYTMKLEPIATQPTVPPDLTPRERKVLDVLTKSEPMGVEKIARLANLSDDTTRHALTDLSLREPPLIHRRPRGYTRL